MYRSSPAVFVERTEKLKGGSNGIGNNGAVDAGFGQCADVRQIFDSKDGGD